jgi:hypothetical protein
MKQKSVLQSFIGPCQRGTIRCALKSEEGPWFARRLSELQTVLDSMPVSYETEGAEKVARLHYFRGSCDAWIVELDKGAPDDAPEDYQSQAWGMVDLGYGPEVGYVSIPELLAAGMELDLYYKPQTLADIRRSRAA